MSNILKRKFLRINDWIKNRLPYGQSITAFQLARNLQGAKKRSDNRYAYTCCKLTTPTLTEVHLVLRLLVEKGILVRDGQEYTRVAEDFEKGVWRCTKQQKS